MIVDQFLQRIRSDVTSRLDEIVALRNERTLKKDLSFVTGGDLLLNTIINEIVLREKVPVNLVTEETFHDEVIATGGYIVVVDPIDGTENFTSGMCEWGVSVSCFLDGKHIGSLLGCPEMNVWMKSGDSITKFFSRVRGLSSSLNKEELIQATQGHEYRILGCCVYNMINVIRGSFLSFENPKGAHSWDILGGLNLALENNLKVTVDGKPYSGEYLQANRKYRFLVEH
jgi:myo-inositol-1(or 4)-monophosphatase